jgi:hypothetical protein
MRDENGFGTFTFDFHSIRQSAQWRIRKIAYEYAQFLGQPEISYDMCIKMCQHSVLRGQSLSLGLVTLYEMLSARGLTLER